ncbi:MAG: MFS transporter [Planctomycetes bacterium]|nr:MFS transporter [Planctomycetota bacterium]
MNQSPSASVMPRLSIMMFLQFFIWGSWYVTAPLFLGKIGFGGPEFGWTYSVGPIAGILSPFFVGMIADRFFATERILGVMHLAGAAAMFAAASLMGSHEPMAFVAGATRVEIPSLALSREAASPAVVNLLFFAHMLCYFPTLALTNSIALHSMRNPEKQFPLIRVFGTIGWIVAGVFVSWQGWDAAVNLFYLAAVSAAVMGVYSFTLPHTPPAGKGKQVRIGELLGFDALGMLAKPSFFVFMLSSFLICIPLAFYYQMAAKFVDHSGLVNPAFKMSFGQMSEIFFMLVMPLFFARLGVKWMLFVGMLAWVVRYALFAATATTGLAPLVLAGIVLHGICYDFFFVTGQIYTDKAAPSHVRAQAQGMLVLFTLGLGMLIGAQAAGQIEKRHTSADQEAKAKEAEAIAKRIAAIESNDRKGPTELEQIAALRKQRSEILLATVQWRQVWSIPSAGAALVMLLFLVAFRDPGRSGDGSAHPEPRP